jgi:hypothetical protein
MATYVNFGHGSKADQFGLGWLRLLASNELAGPAASALGVLGAIAIVGLLLKKDSRRIAFAFAFVLAWVTIYASFLVLRVNLVKTSYLLPLAPAFVMLAAFGLAAVRMVLQRWFGKSIGELGTIALACIILANTIWHSTAVLADYRKTTVPVALTAENKALGDWFARCIPDDIRVFPAPYSYTPGKIRDVWMPPVGMEALNRFNPELIVLRNADIATYLGNTDNLSSNVTRATDDLASFYRLVVHSATWQRGPAFGQFQVYATPKLATAVAEKDSACF